MSDLQNSEESSSKIKTPSKRTPSKRLSKSEKAQLESAEVIKSMGGSLDVEGGRRTRSGVRGPPTTPATPPPAKKSRQSSSTTTPRRGRPKKIPVHEDEMKNEENSINEVQKTPEKDVNEMGETTEKKLDEKITTGRKSDTLEETSGTENVNIINKTDDPVTVTQTLPSKENIIEKSDVDASKSETITHENHIEEKKHTTLNVPDVVVTAATPEKLQSIIKVPESKLDPVEPMEVDSSLPHQQQLEKQVSGILVIDENKVTKPTAPTTNNCTSDEDLMKNNVNKTGEVQEVVETKNKVENTTDEIISNKTAVNDKLNAEADTIIPKNDNKINSIVENDKQEQQEPSNTIIADSDDKKENDNCEPKLSSSPPTEGIVQPQTCN